MNSLNLTQCPSLALSPLPQMCWSLFCSPHPVYSIFQCQAQGCSHTIPSHFLMWGAGFCFQWLWVSLLAWAAVIHKQSSSTASDPSEAVSPSPFSPCHTAQGLCLSKENIMYVWWFLEIAIVLLNVITTFSYLIWGVSFGHPNKDQACLSCPGDKSLLPGSCGGSSILGDFRTKAMIFYIL